MIDFAPPHGWGFTCRRMQISSATTAPDLICVACWTHLGKLDEMLRAGTPARNIADAYRPDSILAADAAARGGA